MEGGSLDIVGVLLAHLQASSDGQTASLQSPVCSDSRGREEVAEADPKRLHHQSPSYDDGSLQQSASADARLRCQEVSSAGLSTTPSERSATAAGQPPGSDCQPSDQHTPPPTSSAASFTPLHMAAYKGHAELLPYLLQAGYAAATYDALHRTPLHYAALQGCQAFELPAGTLQEADTSAAASSGPASDTAGEDDQAQEAVAAARKAAHPVAVTGPSRLPWEALATHSSSESSTGCTAHSQRHAGSCSQHPSGRAIPGEAAGPLLPLDAGVMMPHVAAPGRGRALDARPAAVQWTGFMPRARVDFPGASELLMAAGTDVYAVDTYGRTALHYAAGEEPC